MNATHESVEKARQFAAWARDNLLASLRTSTQTEGILLIAAVRDANHLVHSLEEIESAIRHDSEADESTPEKP